MGTDFPQRWPTSVVPAVAKGHVVMGLLFFPRGGSAQVARYLSVALVHADWSIELVTGSLGDLGEKTHAPTFFAGTPLCITSITPTRCGRSPRVEARSLSSGPPSKGNVAICFISLPHETG